EPLVENVTLSIFRGEKVGIVGRNGAGKSTLMALIRGELAPDAGEFDCPGNLAFASVLQELPHSQRPVVEHVIDGDEALRRIEADLEASYLTDDGNRQAMLLAEYEHAGGYTARARAASLLDGLGFDADAIDRPISEFSGGLRMRANLARALMCRSDVLLLDEPTNHLDLDAVLWLEGWLRAYSGTLLLISHDREFLDAVVGRILQITDRRIFSYAGNYSRFEEQSAAVAAQTRAANEKIRREAEHVRSFVERFRAKASKARQAQSRLKWLERLPQIVELHAEHTFEWQFAAPRKVPRPLVVLDDIDAGYGERVVVGGVKLSLGPEARLGILGRNGAGKSTLMRLIAGEMQPLDGTRTASPDLETGFFAQLEVDQLDRDGTAILELTRRGGPELARWSEQQKRDHLGQFGFRGERVFEPVARFSGGERARLSLAILVARRPNLLLLDEPTNHLDFETRESLLLALQEFAGAVIIVSHDRALLRGVCDEFLLVGDGVAQPFDGDLEDYASWLGKRRPGASQKVATPGTAGSDGRRDRGRSSGHSRSGDAPVVAAARSRETRRDEAAARTRLAPLRREMEKLEAQLAGVARERETLEARLVEPAAYDGPDAHRELGARHAALQTEIEQLESRWLELGEELESLLQRMGGSSDPPERGSLVRQDG
ncbi:MAG: ATP-binding cassette domain-containing protein, partial [Gammaproteobacteria bacterium]|nr:ATP-binding cassette domain-containing protein [Gammaproteobacteria bacterium]